MAVIPPHQLITSWEDWRDTHRHQGRIPFPRRDGRTSELIIINWHDSTGVNDLPLSAEVDAVRTLDERRNPWRIGIIWSATRPQEKYPISVIWVSGPKVVRL